MLKWMTRTAPNKAPCDRLPTVEHPDELVARASADPAFHEFNARFVTAGITNWLYEPEKMLHFGIGAFAPGNGVLVEVGTFEGGSAVFSAAGVARRGYGRLVSVDPHLGGPPWTGMGPHQRTLEKFKTNSKYCGVADWVESRVGDSAAVAATWHAEPVTSVFIDADHSYLGALKDFECWVPKLAPGGLALFDDADDPYLPELLELIEDLKQCRSVRFLGQVQGVAVFRREPTPVTDLLSELSRLAARKGLYRPWDMTAVHALPVPPGYGRSALPAEHGMPDAYMLCFLAKCGPASYGISPGAAESERALIRAVSTDRGDGPVVELSATTPQVCRVIVCRPEELTAFVPQLLPGGVCITRNFGSLDQEPTLAVRRQLLDAGLEGCGWGGAIHWGVYRPFELSSDAVLRYTYAAYKAESR